MATYESVRYSFGGTLVTALQSPNMADGTVTNTEFQFINTLSSNAQTQLNSKFGAAGGTFTGDITLADNIDFNVGNGNDMIITSNGSQSFIKGNSITIEDTSGNDMATFVANGAAKLFFGGGKKLETTSGGVDVTGNIAVTGTVDGSDIAALNTVAYAALPRAGGTMTGNLDLNDNVRARFGSSQDLQIFHNGTDSIIDNGTGQLVINADVLQLKNGASNATLANLNQAGAVNLFFNGSTKMSTTNTGININGTATATTFSGNLNASNLTSGTVPDARLPASALTSAVKQVSVSQSGSNFSSTTTIPFDSSSPTSSEGIEVMTHSFTPTASNSRLLHVLQTAVTNASQGGAIIWSIFNGSSNIGAFANTTGTSSTWSLVTGQALESSSSSTSARTYTCRFGPNTSRGHWLQTNSSVYNLNAKATWTIYELEA